MKNQNNMTVKGEAPKAIPDALRNFDELPNAAHVRQPVVEALFGCSAATVWRRVKAGIIPKPHKLSQNCTTWNVGELRIALGVGGNHAVQ